jgi:hypothetical protein
MLGEGSLTYLKARDGKKRDSGLVRIGIAEIHHLY